MSSKKSVHKRRIKISLKTVNRVFMVIGWMEVPRMTKEFFKKSIKKTKNK